MQCLFVVRRYRGPLLILSSVFQTDKIWNPTVVLGPLSNSLLLLFGDAPLSLLVLFMAIMRTLLCHYPLRQLVALPDDQEWNLGACSLFPLRLVAHFMVGYLGPA